MNMRECTVKRDELLAILRENREKHRGVFEAAQIGYRERAIEELERRLEDARQGRHIDIMIRLAPPEDHTADYDRIIRMAEMNIGDEIELVAQEFDQFVNDRWQWRDNFISNSSVYAAGAVARTYGT